MDGHDIWFEEDDADPSDVIDVVGEDPRLLDRLIEGIRIRKWTRFTFAFIDLVS